MSASEIILSKEQKKHADRLLSILIGEYDSVTDSYDSSSAKIACLDTSDRGLGKTRVAIYNALRLGCKVLVVCPSTLKGHWKSKLTLYGQEWIDIVSFESLAGQPDRKDKKNGKKTFNHPWLTFKNEEYVATSKLTSLSRQGFLLILDEVFYIKSSTALRSKAAFALIKGTVYNPDTGESTPSRVYNTSNTPIDFKKYTGSLLRLLGVVRTEKMFEYDHKTRTYFSKEHGMSDLIGYCERIDPVATKRLIVEYPIKDKANRERLPYIMYTTILKKEVTSSMPRIKKPYDVKIYHKFYHYDDLNRLEIERGNARLRMYTKKGEEVATKTIERAKIGPVIKEVLEKLSEEPNKKYIIFVKHKETMNTLYQSFEKHGAIVVNSDIPNRHRGVKYDKFKANDNKCRVLILSTAVGGTGLNLDDTVGNHPRVAYIFPCFSYINDYQAAGRIDRVYTTKSDVVVNYVYCGNCTPREKVYSNQKKKSDVNKKVVSNSRDIISFDESIEWYQDTKDNPVFSTL